jgi:hypothetical protein
MSDSAHQVCVNCRFFYPGYRGPHGECTDPTKLIHPLHASEAWSSKPQISDGSIFTCRNWQPVENEKV